MKNVKMPGVQSSHCIFKCEKLQYYYVFMNKISIMVLQTRARGWKYMIYFRFSSCTAWYILLWPDWFIQTLWLIAEVVVLCDLQEVCWHLKLGNEVKIISRRTERKEKKPTVFSFKTSSKVSLKLEPKKLYCLWTQFYMLELWFQKSGDAV